MESRLPLVVGAEEVGDDWSGVSFADRPPISNLRDVVPSQQ